MKTFKRAGALLLTAAMITQLLPTAGAAVSSGNAKSYLQVVQSKPQANSYLVDFDGDGADELVLAWQGEHNEQMGDKTAYEVWNASGKIASGENYQVSIAKSAQTLVLSLQDDSDWRDEITYQTLQNGKWVTVLSAQRQLNPSMRSDYSVDGKTVTETEYQASIAAYQKTQDIPYTSGAHSVKNQLINAIDTSAGGYEDVLSTLSASEKKALFEDLLRPCVVAGARDCSKMTDEVFWTVLRYMIGSGCLSPHDKGASFDSESVCYVFTREQFTAMTQQFFGYTIDYSRYIAAKKPVADDDCVYVVVNNNVYYRTGAMGWVLEEKVSANSLYQLSNNIYCAGLTHTSSQDSTFESTAHHYAIVKKNPDGTWTLRRLYPENYVPTSAELAAFVAPSNWAKAEVEAASAAGLIPELTGTPAWQDNATRLQFAELAVRFAEKATGKTLAAAPSSTFSDTKSDAVLKAYQAGIVNGTSATAFSPTDSLTREQLAAMLWRAIQYVQKETGKNALTAGGSLTGYADANKVSSWAKDAVSSLAQNGIMKGTSSTLLSPAESCSVEQSVLLVYRTYLKLQ